MSGSELGLWVCAGFANEGQFLLMNSASLADMNARITALADSNTKPTAHADSKKKKTVSSVGHLSRFRPNLLVGGTGMGAYEEDKWVRVCIGTNDFSTAGEASLQCLHLAWYLMLHVMPHLMLHLMFTIHVASHVTSHAACNATSNLASYAACYVACYNKSM